MTGNILLPVTLVCLAFVVKLVVDRRAATPDLIQALLELPVDIAFLALSFLASFLIAVPDRAAEGLMTFVIWIVGSIIVVVLWRRSHRAFTEDRHIAMVMQAAVNYTLCVFALVVATRLLMRVIS